VEDFFAKVPVEPGPLLISVRGLGKEAVFHDVSFDVHQGEILGFAGLIGAGRTDVALALFGVEPADTGTVVFNGQEVAIHTPQQAMQLGIAYVTEDRRQLGLILPMSITSNVTLPTLSRYLNGLGLVRQGQETITAEAYREQLSIRTPSLDAEVGKLSGGNQQKVVLSKWLNARPKLLILDEPTRGIDVRTKAEVHHIISDLAAQGLGIILISSDLPEVLAMSDRILVMREGRQMGIFSQEEATQETIMTAAMGQNSQAEAVVTTEAGP
jgi:rhamnose transport system ATP-binding protein